MDALLTTLVMTLVAEMGDRTQLLLAVLAIRFVRHRQIFLGFASATIVNCALSAFAGILIAEIITGRSLLMFQAMAMLFAAAAMLWPRRKLDRLDGWRMPPFWIAFLGCLILEFGDKSQFLIMAAAAQSGHPVLVAIGGAIGIAAAAIPAFAVARRVEGWGPFKWIRMAGGVVFAVLGVLLAFRALLS